MSYLKSKKLERQNYSFGIVSRLQGNKKEYKSKVESLGMMIYNNGLVSTLSQLKLKENELYNHLMSWIVKNRVVNFPFDNSKDLLNEVLEINDSMVLHALTLELLAITDTLKEILKAEVE